MRTQVIGSPPDELDQTQFIVSIIKSRGNSFEVCFADSDKDRALQALPSLATNPTVLVSLSSKLRNQFFIKRGGLALVDIEPVNKMAGVITNVVSDRRAWEKETYWPPEWKTAKEESTLDLPPSDYSEDEVECTDDAEYV